MHIFKAVLCVEAINKQGLQLKNAVIFFKLNIFAYICTMRILINVNNNECVLLRI